MADDAAKRERLAAALRANLRRRKAAPIDRAPPPSDEDGRQPPKA